MFTRKVPIYEPYLFLLLSTTWEKTYPGDEFLAPDWIRHESISLRVKPNWPTLLLVLRRLLLGGLLMRRMEQRMLLRTVVLGIPIVPLSPRGLRS